MCCIRTVWCTEACMYRIKFRKDRVIKGFTQTALVSCPNPIQKKWHETNSPKLAQWVYCQVTSRSTASYQWECVSILPWSPVIFSYSHLATISLRVNSLDTQGDSAWQDVNKRNSWAYSGWSQALKDVVSPHKFQRFFSAAQQVLFAWIRFGVSLAPPPTGLGMRLELISL